MTEQLHVLVGAPHDQVRDLWPQPAPLVLGSDTDGRTAAVVHAFEGRETALAQVREAARAAVGAHGEDADWDGHRFVGVVASPADDILLHINWSDADGALHTLPNPDLTYELPEVCGFAVCQVVYRADVRLFAVDAAVRPRRYLVFEGRDTGTSDRTYAHGAFTDLLPHEAVASMSRRLKGFGRRAVQVLDLETGLCERVRSPRAPDAQRMDSMDRVPKGGW